MKKMKLNSVKSVKNKNTLKYLLLLSLFWLLPEITFASWWWWGQVAAFSMLLLISPFILSTIIIFMMNVFKMFLYYTQHEKQAPSLLFMSISLINITILLMVYWGISLSLNLESLMVFWKSLMVFFSFILAIFFVKHIMKAVQTSNMKKMVSLFILSLMNMYIFGIWLIDFLVPPMSNSYDYYSNDYYSNDMIFKEEYLLLIFILLSLSQLVYELSVQIQNSKKHQFN